MNPNSVPVSSIYHWGPFNFFFFLHVLIIFFFIMRLLYSLKTEHGEAGEGFLDGCCLATLVAEGQRE